MQTLLSMLLSHTGPTLFEELTELNADIDATLSSCISDAVANNDIRSFESVAKDILLKTNYDVRVQDSIKKHLESMPHGKLFDIVETMTQGSSTLPVAWIIVMFTVAVLFKDGVPLILKLAMLLIAVAFFVFIILAWYLKAFMQQSSQAVNRLFGASFKKPTRNDAIAVHASMGKAANHLIKRASCGNMVSQDIVQRAVSIQAIAVMYNISDACGKVVASLKGRLDQGEKFSGLAEKNPEEINSNVKSKLEELSTSITEIREGISQRTEAVAKTAEFADEWTEEVKSLEKSLETCLKRWPARPDALLLPEEKATKTKIREKIQERVNELVKKFKKESKLCQVDDDIDCTVINTRCLDMVEALAYSPHLDKVQQQVINDAIESRRLLAAELQKKINERTEVQHGIRHCDQMLKIAQSTLDQKLIQVRSRIALQRDMNKQLGQGSFKKWGSAPRGDMQAQLLEKYWQEGQWDKLFSYELKGSGDFGVKSIFGVKVSAELTDKQSEGVSLYNKYIEEEDQLKSDFWHQVKQYHEKKNDLEGQMDLLCKAEECARKELNDAQCKGQNAWCAFRMQCPVEFAQIQLLYKVNNYVGTVAAWTFHMNSDLIRVKRLLRDLEDELDMEPFHPRNLIPIVKDILDQLQSQDSSGVAFFKSIGGRDLRRLMRPIDSGSVEVVSDKMEEFIQDERQTSSSLSIECKTQAVEAE